MIDPLTPEEWTNAVDAAHAALVLESARKYGLITGGPYVHVARCEYLLKLGKARGIIPGSNAAGRLIMQLMNAAKVGDPAGPERAALLPGGEIS